MTQPQRQPCTSGGAHRWTLETPNGSRGVRGECRRCGAVSMFRASHPSDDPGFGPFGWRGERETHWRVTHGSQEGTSRQPGGDVMTARQMARHTDPGPSHDAAENMVLTGRHARQMAVVLDLVRLHSGWTSAELAVWALGAVDRYQIARRLPELERRGLVKRGEPRNGGVTWWPR